MLWSDLEGSRKSEKLSKCVQVTVEWGAGCLRDSFEFLAREGSVGGMVAVLDFGKSFTKPGEDVVDGKLEISEELDGV
jgi:hypothetical protein